MVDAFYALFIVQILEEKSAVRTVVRRTAGGKKTVFSSQEGAADHQLDQQHNNGTKSSEATVLKQGHKVGVHEWAQEVGFHEWARRRLS